MAATGAVTEGALPATIAVPVPQARLRQLDSMRGLAALVVMLGHLHQLLVPEGRHALAWRLADALPKRLLDTAAAVDFFFVLSGFVLALPYVGRSARPLEVDVFFVRRILRIMPTYWAGLGLALGLRAFAQPFWHALPFPLHMHWEVPLSREDVGQAILLIGQLDPLLINGPVWSLAVEMQMSLLLPLVIALFMLRPSLRDGALVLAVLAATLHFGGPAAGAPSLRFMPLFALGVFAAAVAGEFTRWLHQRARATFRTLVVAALILVFARAWTPSWSFPDMRHEYLTAMGSAMLILLAVARPASFRHLENPGAIYLGDLSYSLYLIHLPIVLALSALLFAHGAPRVVIALVAGTGALAGAIILHHTVERPSLGWVKRAGQWLSARRRVQRRSPA